MTLEEYIPYIFLTGLALSAIGFFALLVGAFQVNWRWGILVLIFPPLALAFAMKHYRQAWIPAATLALGFALTVFPPLYMTLIPIDLGPRERVVGDERHLTLTGWDRQDYALIAQKPDVVILQMANPDVTDATISYLKDFAKLRELDLNDTKVTDSSLDTLRTLRALQRLRLRNTAITDDGFKRVLAEMDSLKELDLRGTSIGKESVQGWKDSKPGRRAMQ